MMNKWIYRFVLSLYALTTPSSVCYSQVVMHSSLDTVVARAKTTQESIIGFKKTVVPSYLRSGGDEEKELVEEEEEIPYTDVTDYCGNYIYENGTLKTILVEGGYITFDSSSQPVYHFYLKDHLGNNRVVANACGQVEQVNHYYPYGGLMAESTCGDVQRYKYNGKELDRMLGLDWYDYGARHYDGALTMWRTVDPLCENYYNISPYVYCVNSPINAFDPDGRDWFFYSLDGHSDPTWNWRDEHEYHTGILDSSGKEYIIKGHKAVVEFNGYYNETLGDANNLYSQDALLADVTVYGPHGRDDIKEYKGFSMTSNPSRYGVVADGDYTVNRVVKPGPFNSPWAINNRGRVKEWTNFNPKFPERNPAYLTGVFIHRSNNNGFAGEFFKKGKYHGISEGCLLIRPDQWDEFNKQLAPVSTLFLRIKRR